MTKRRFSNGLTIKTRKKYHDQQRSKCSDNKRGITMSLYNMMCGFNPAAGRLLAAINLDPNIIPRFRDVWINSDMTKITVHTRTGGGNRDDYEDQNNAMTAHPLYLRDSDDDFDSTFANFTFRVPEEEKAKLLAEIEEATRDKTPENKERVLAAITEQPREKFNKVMRDLKSS